MRISVVIPTIRGRNKLLQQTIAAYQRTGDFELIVVRGRKTIGDAWNAGAEVAHGDFLHFSADDVEPQPGWAEAAMDAVERNIYPAPRITKLDWSLEACGSLGAGMLLGEVADGTVCNNSAFPFMRMEDWRLIGPAPDIHYYADDYLSWRARQYAGLEIRVVRDYCLHHLEGSVGRATHQAAAFNYSLKMREGITEEAKKQKVAA